MNTKLAQIEKISGKKLRNFMTVDFGRKEKTAPDTYSLIIENKKLEEFIEDTREIIEPDFAIFIGTTNFLAPINDKDIKKGVPYSEVVISKVDSWKDILRLAESNAVNFDMETEDLIDKLEEYDDNFGISILQAETDTIVVEFISLPEELVEIAENIYEFCPDIIDQGSGDINDIIDSLENSNSIFLWWD